LPKEKVKGMVPGLPHAHTLEETLLKFGKGNQGFWTFLKPF